MTNFAEYRVNYSPESSSVILPEEMVKPQVLRELVTYLQQNPDVTSLCLYGVNWTAELSEALLHSGEMPNIKQLYLIPINKDDTILFSVARSSALPNLTTFDIVPMRINNVNITSEARTCMKDSKLFQNVEVKI